MLSRCTSWYHSFHVMLAAQWRQQGPIADVTVVGARRQGSWSSAAAVSRPLLMGGMTADCGSVDAKSRWMLICVARRELLCEGAVLKTIVHLPVRLDGRGEQGNECASSATAAGSQR